ncbi:MAG: glycosyltransferase [candidate division SR1 bacterium]|nr:glycosyltransferase [candidate division SR1 bacterium]
MQYDYLSIGIIARNEGKVIARTLQYLLKQTYPLDKIEIVFVDGNSTDTTVDEVKNTLEGKVSYKIINERSIKNPKGPNYGHSRARNVAIMHMDSRSKYMAWIDADCRADKNWLISLWEIIKNSGPDVAGAGGPRYVETQGSISKTELVLNYYFTSTIMSMGNPAYCERNVTYMPSVAGYNSIYKKEILQKYMYDTTYPFNTDDIEINYRISRDALKFLYSAHYSFTVIELQTLVDCIIK